MGGSSSKQAKEEVHEKDSKQTPYDADGIPKSVMWEFTAIENGKKRFLGQVFFNLYQDVPKTAKNFGEISRGHQLSQPITNRAGAEVTKLHFKDTFSHRIIPGFMIQAGDTTEALLNGPRRGARPGTGGASIYGGKFEDENFNHKHAKYKLSCANAGANTNGSQIFICTAPCDHLNGKHVVFGEVADDNSRRVIDAVEKFGSRDGTVVDGNTVYISDSVLLEYW